MPALFFLSDYGNADEFAGVVRAVLHRLAPGTVVVDLSHEVPPFDVVAGADLLLRSVPHLGPGTVLAVVDPGVGSARRPIAVHVGDRWSPAGRRADRGPEWLVGPDNGLLLPAAEALGGPDGAFVLDAQILAGRTGADAGTAGRATTFDGRDLFAPAAAHLVTGGDPAAIGARVDPGTLVATTRAVAGPGGGTDPRHDGVVAPVTWVDRFGNVQLDLAAHDLASMQVALGDRIVVSVEDVENVARGSGHRSGARPLAGRSSVDPTVARRVGVFADLAPGELGVILDANGRVAVVLDRARAAEALGLEKEAAGERVRLRLVADRPATGAPEGPATGSPS